MFYRRSRDTSYCCCCYCRRFFFAAAAFKYVQHSCQGKYQRNRSVVMCPQTSRHRIFPVHTPYHLPAALVHQNFVADICKWLGIYIVCVSVNVCAKGKNWKVTRNAVFSFMLFDTIFFFFFLIKETLLASSNRV